MEAGATKLLIDAGLSPRALAERLVSAGVDPGSLAGCLLSHEHTDHIRGAAGFSRKWGVPLIGSRGTYAAAGLGASRIASYRVLEAGIPVEVGGLTVKGLRVPHDAAEPLAFVVSFHGSALGHATDIGHVGRSMTEEFRACDAILLESNYDPSLLRDGPYPWPLKERILGPNGHLSNQDVARYLASGLPSRCRVVLLAHLSQQNNHPELARMTAERALERSGLDPEVRLTGPEGTGWIVVGGSGAQLRLF